MCTPKECRVRGDKNQPKWAFPCRFCNRHGKRLYWGSSHMKKLTKYGCLRGKHSHCRSKAMSLKIPPTPLGSMSKPISQPSCLLLKIFLRNSRCRLWNHYSHFPNCFLKSKSSFVVETGFEILWMWSWTN